MSHKEVLSITIDLKVYPLPIRNKVVDIVKKSNRRFSLENQEIKVDIITMKMVMEVL